MCTAVSFLDKENNLYFGRNLDVPATYGQKVIIAPRNHEYDLRHGDKMVTTKAVIGMGINIGEYPLFFDCANENGLAIANLNFPCHMMDGRIVDTLEFCYYDHQLAVDKLNLACFEFMPWILETFNTVEEILEYDLAKNINFVDTAFNEHFPPAPGHFIISDSKDCIVIEPRRDGIHVFKNPVGVMTNDPSFDWHLMNLNQYLGLSPIGKDPVKWGDKQLHALGVGTGAIGMPGDWTPASRFVKASFINNFYPDKDGEIANTTRLFNTLKAVAMPEGSVDGEVTIYTSCYSTKTKTYYYDTNDNFETRSFVLEDKYINADKLIVFDEE